MKYYIHTYTEIQQSPKKQGNPCGDVLEVYRDAISTNVIVCDGIGSGLKAHIYARMCCSRIKQLLECGESLKKCFDSVGITMNQAWGTDQPFSVFTIARILENGNTTILTYDMPPPIFLGQQYAEIPESRIYFWEKAEITETHLQINQGEGLVLMSDGITQAGLGNGLINGWESEGVAHFINQFSKNSEDYGGLARSIHDQAKEYWGKKQGDDCTVAIIHNRRGITLNVLTGTPENKEDDSAFVQEFMQSEGFKIVCGGTTTKVLSREIRRPLEIEEEGSSVTPPTFQIRGIDFATEGVITLNQLYNILDEDIVRQERRNIVVELAELFQTADKINFWVGTAKNIGNTMIELKQQGIIKRIKIVELIVEKLKEMNKLVVVKSK